MMKLQTFQILILAIVHSFGCLAFADWPQFLGPQRNGISDLTGLIDSFGSNGPEVIWRAPGGVGMSAVAVVEQYALTTWNENGQQVLVALDAKSGERIWSTPLGPAYQNQMGNGPRATPTIVDGAVYTFTGEGILSATKLSSGNPVWSFNALKQLEAKAADYGMACSPLVVADLVIVQVGSPKGAVAAFSKSDGALIWTSGKGPAAYSSPMLMNVAGKTQVVCMTGYGAQGLDPETGAELWQYPFKTAYDCNTATPISVGDHIFISSGENHGCVMLKVSRIDDVYQVSERWASVDTKSVMRNEWQTSVLKDGFLYGFDNVGSAGPITHLTCINAQTGERAWRETRFGKGNLVLADGKLWITMMSGELVLAQANPQRYEELGRADLFRSTRQTLSISGGMGYVRDDREVVCVRLTKP